MLFKLSPVHRRVLAVLGSLWAVSLLFVVGRALAG